MNPTEPAERTRSKLLQRRDAYRAVFLASGSPELGPMAEIVMRDLARFCHVRTSSVKVSPVSKSIDPYAVLMAEGHREVYNYIAQQLHMSTENIQRLAFAKEPE